MSRRHRGRPHHHAPAGDAPRRNPVVDPSGPSSPEPTASRTAAAAPPRVAGTAGLPAERDIRAEPRLPTTAADAVVAGPDAPELATQVVNAHPPSAPTVNGDRSGQCTAPQLRRFIKSRPYVPMHELRRRFSINGEDDDVTPVRLDPGWIYVGLPSHEGHLLGDLLRTGEIGYELSLDPRTPIVVGVYPMRPIPRT